MGLAVARHLAGKGWRLSLLDVNPERGEQAAKEVNGIFTKTDVTKYDDQASAFQKTREKYGQIDFGESIQIHRAAVADRRSTCSVRQCWNSGQLPILHSSE